MSLNVKLEVELRPSSEPFNDADASHIYTSGFVSSGNDAVAKISNLIPKDGWYTTGGDSQGFHWRARARNEGGSASGWVEMGEIGNTDFVAQISLPMKAVGLAVELVHYPYLWGGKGWDFNQNMFVPVTTVQAGYHFYNPDLKKVDFGSGVDCSGLVMWSYDRSYNSTLAFRDNMVSYEGAGGQYQNNSQEVPESDLMPGDLMFFKKSKTDNTISHVAMYVGMNSDGNDVVEAASPSVGIIYSKKSQREARVEFLGENGFRRVNQPSLAMSGIQISLGSPGYLSITDPDGYSVTKDSVIPSDEEYIREIPGELYYSEMEKGTDGYPITRVYSPKFKEGNYTIKVIPREGVSQNETYSLDVKTGTGTVNLAQHVPIGLIPSEGYKVAVSGEGEVVPVPTTLFCPLLAQSATYRSLTPASTCTFTNGPKTLQLKDSTCNPIAGARVNVRKANGTYLTYVQTNADGLANLSGYANPDASYFEVDYHGATYSTGAGTFSAGTGVQTHSYELSLKGSDCNPITGARVNLRKTDGSYVTYATTNTDGKASFEVVPNASMKLEADYHGGTWMSEPRGPDTNITLGTDKFSLALADGSGGAISSARVNLRKANNSYVTYTTTNDSGLASFEVMPNVPMVLEVDYHGATYKTASSSTHEQVKIATIPFGMRLLDSTSVPIAGARVNLRKADSSYVTYGLTNADGKASFELVPGAQMKLEVDYHGATYLTNTLNAVTNPLTAIQTKTFGLVLLTNTGEPIVGARVNLHKADGSYVTYATTNTDGKASFEAVPYSQMRLEVDYHGATYLTSALGVDTTPLTSVSAYALSLELRDSAGNIIPNARVNLRKADNSYITYALTNGQGIASFQVVPGAIMILEANYNGGTYETVATTVSGDTTLHVQTSTITVHLTAQGQPLTNMRVDLLNGSGAYVTYTTTNVAGGLSFEVLPGAPHKVRVTYNGSSWISDIVTGGTEVMKDF